MKALSILVLLFALAVPALAASEIINFRHFDGEETEGKLSLPEGDAGMRVLIIYVPGTGPATYINRRKMGAAEFNYFDMFAEEFNRRGVAFFTYNKRGVTVGDKPPMYENIDREKFKKVVPSVEVQDIATYIATLRKDKRLKKASVVLLGWSEGSVLAAMAAENKKSKIAALFLAGYVHDNMGDVIKWQNSGASSMIILRKAFDTDKDNAISRSEYESKELAATAYRVRGLKDSKFEQLDFDGSGLLNAADFGILAAPKYDALLSAYKRGDEAWIWDNYFHISTAWLNEHFALEANKDRLLRLKLPIYIFHGEDDANCDVQGVYDLRKRFDKAKKKNLHENVYKDHDHNLNFTTWLIKKEIPEGIKMMFESAAHLNK